MTQCIAPNQICIDRNKLYNLWTECKLITLEDNLGVMDVLCEEPHKSNRISQKRKSDDNDPDYVPKRVKIEDNPSSYNLRPRPKKKFVP